MTGQKKSRVKHSHWFRPSDLKLTRCMTPRAVFVFLAIYLLSFAELKSQTEWSTQSDYILTDDAQRVVVDPAGQYIYVVGSLNTGLGGIISLTSILSGTSISSTLFGYGGKDGYLAKYTNTGSLVWTINFGGSGEDVATGLCIGGDGNLYLTGYFTASMNMPSVDGSPTQTMSDPDGSSKRDGFVASYTPNGDSRWVKYNGGDNHDHTHSVCAVTGGIAVVGDYEKSGNTNIQTTTPYEFGETDMYVAKYGYDGSSSWFISGGTPIDEYLATPDFRTLRWNIASDGTNIYALTTTGQGAYQTYNTSNSLSSAFNFSDSDSQMDLVIHCISNTGNISWVKPIQVGSKNVAGAGIAVNNTGLYLVSSMSENITWPDGSTNALGSGFSDIVVARLRKNNGSRVWHKLMGGTEGGTPFNIPLELKLSNDSLVYFAGRYRKSMLIDASTFLGTAGSYDAGFVARFSYNGTYLNGTSSNLTDDANALSLALNHTTNACIVCGSTKADLVSGTNILNFSEDSFVLSKDLSDCSDLSFTSSTLSNDTICFGQHITMDATSTYGTIQWQSSESGTIWTNLASGNPISLIPDTTTYFRAQLTFSGCADVFTTPWLVHVDYPQTAEAGNDVLSCTDTLIISGNAAQYGNIGHWRILAGTGTIEDYFSQTTRIHTFQDPVNIAWVIDCGACGVSSDIIQINSDHTGPSFFCNGNIILPTDSFCRATVPSLTSTLIAYDDCTPSASIVFTQDPPSGTILVGQGTWTGTIRATDLNGNSTTCPFTIYTNDTLPPVIACPAHIFAPNDPGLCEATLTLPVPTIGDNCGIRDVHWWLTGATTDASSGPGIHVLTSHTFLKGLTEVHYVAWDSTGHNTHCIFNVNVYDDEAPIVTCADTVTVSTTTASCTGMIGSLVPTMSDNCVITFWHNSYNGLQDAAGEYPIGTTNVIWNVGDASGHASTCATAVVVVDSIPPVIICPPSFDTVLTAGMCMANVVMPVATAFDNCPGVIINNDYNGGGSFVAGNFLTGETVITYKATDAAGNPTTCTASVTVLDTIAPIITCIPDLYSVTDINLCTDSVTVPMPTVSNGCGTFTLINDQTFTNNASGIYPVGTTPVTWTVTDQAGYSSQCVTNVHVTDNENPVVLCANDTTLYSTTISCNAILSTLMSPTATDNCGIASIVSDHPSTTYLPGNNIVHWLITDIHGRSTQCNQIITVLDTIAPQITCPIDKEYDTPSTGCSKTVMSIGNPVVNDNCGIQSVFNDHPTTSYSLGDNFVTWTVFDVNGNSNYCIQNIKIIDNTDPLITCPPTISVNTDANLCTATIADIGSPPMVWDNCTLMSVTHTHASSIYVKGTTTVVWTATDNSGNSSTCLQTILVNDVTVPTLGCLNDTVVEANNGCQATVFLPAPSISDNCTLQKLVWQLTGATVATSPTTGFNNLTTWTFNPGITYVTYLLRDTSGNESDCTFTVTVTETEEPNLVCPISLTYYTTIDECFVNLLPAMIGSATANDNCGSTLVWSDFLGGNIAPGDFIVNWHAADSQGNQSTCQQTITVIDAIAPIIDCPASITEFATTGTCEKAVTIPTPAVTDNCTVVSIENNFNFTDNASGIYPVGITHIDWVATDANGVSGFCHTMVEIQDIELPEITCPNDTTFNNDPGECYYSTVHIGDPVVSDNCGILTTYCDHPTLEYHVGVTTVEWHTEDLSHNINSCLQQVTVLDVEFPLIDCPNDIVLHTDSGQCSHTLTLTDLGWVQVTDNCGILAYGNNHPSEEYPVGTTSIEWTASDAAGNTSTCTQYVTIVDTTPPTILCPADTLLEADSISCGIVFNSIPGGIPIVQDECGIALLYHDFNLPDTLSVGDYEILWTVIDNNDNLNSCTQYFTIKDATAPLIDCPDTIYRYLDNTCGYVMEDLTSLLLVSDNCSSQAELFLSQFPSAGEQQYDPQEYLATFEVMDAALNVSGCQTLIILLDTIAPVLNCPADQIIPAISNCEGILPNYVFSGSISEECGTATISQMPVAGSVVLSNTIVTLMATDASGNTSTCQFNVSTTDDESPLLSVPALDPIYSDSICEAIIPDYTSQIIYSDNCTENQDLIIVQSPPAGDIVYYPGSVEIIFFVSDAVGNTTSDTINVSVLDTIAPYIECPDTQYVTLDYSCYAEIPDYTSFVYVSDGCSFTTFTQSPPAGESITEGTHDIHLIVSDDFGNTDSCEFVLIAQDVSYPEIWMQKIVNISSNDLFTYMTADSLLNVDDGNASMVDSSQAFPCSYFVELPQPFVQDNCGIQSVTNNITGTDNASAFYPIGYTAIQWAVTDIYGNTTYDVVELTISYDEPVAVFCPADTLASNDPDSCGAWLTLSPPVSGPHCSPITYWNDYNASNNSSDYYPVGTNYIQWEISDDDGNYAYCLQTIMVEDVQAPQVICPGSDTIQTSVGLCEAYYEAPILDIEDNCGIQTFGWDVPSGFYSPGDYYLNFSVTDDALNYNGCNMLLVVEDIEQPWITCASDTILYTTTTTCDTEYLVTADGGDNCGTYVITHDHSSNIYPVGTTEVIWTITDGYGNMNTCHQMIEVLDSIIPAINCETFVSDTIYNADAALFVTIPQPTVSDNCTITYSNSYNITTNASDLYPIGEHEVIWTVVDDSGNEATCTTTVEVISTYAPFIICPQDTVVYSSTTTCDAEVQMLVPVTNLTNPINDFNSTSDATGIYPSGNTTVIWSANDVLNNTYTCDVVVTVIDTIAPLILCPNDTTIEVGSATCDATFIPVAPTSFDICGIADITWNTTQTNFAPGNYEIIYTAMDVNGNSASCNQIINVVDLVIPQVDCPADTTIYTTAAACEASIVLNATGSDNCTNFNITSDVTDFTFGTGTHVITWTIVDEAGNDNTCLTNVTVLDTIAPTIDCMTFITDTIANADVEMFIAVPAVDVDDNCNYNFSNSHNTTTDASDFYPIGEHEVIWTVVDASGNEATCTTTVEVISTYAPFIICPQDTIVYSSTTTCDAEVQMSVPVTNLTNPINDFNSTSDATGIYPSGNTTVIWSANDVLNNTYTCDVVVTVIDTIAPLILCPNDTTIEVGSATCDATFIPVAPTSFDICGIDDITWNTTQTSFAPGNYEIIYTAMDVHGNSASCNQIINVVDLVIPQVDCPSDTTIYTTAATCEASIVLNATGSDNCTNFNITSDVTDFTFETGTHVITWTILDEAGNDNTCLTNVTVLDTIAPMILCPNDTTLEVGSATCDATFIPVAPTSFDICGIADITWNTTQTNFAPGSYEIIYTAMDVHGNSASCNQIINVVDLVIPQMDCPADTTIYTTAIDCEASIVLNATGSDNCTNFNITSDVTDFTFGTGTHVITWSIVDEAGNDNTCLTNVTVLDTIAPIINCIALASDTILFSELSAYISIAVPMVEDACVVNFSNDYNNTTNASDFYSEGIHTISWIAIDDSGNQATCTTTVEVISLMEEGILCPNDTIVYTSAIECGASIDIPLPMHNLIDVTNDLNGNLDASGYFDVGEYEITWSGLNGEGALLTCATSIIVTDSISPQMTCQSDTTVQTTSGLTTTYVTPVTPAISDNCGIATLTNDLFTQPETGVVLSVGTHNITWIATDINGNEATCSTNIYVVDTIYPEVTCPDTIFQYVDAGLCSAHVLISQPELLIPEINITMTNDSGFTMGSYYDLPTGSSLVQWTITDINNNTTYCATTYLVTDNLAPIVMCEDTITAFVTGQECLTWVEVTTPNYIENCQHSSTTNSYNNTFSASDFYPQGSTEVNWFISDINGNLGSCTTIIQIVDTIGPELSCPDTIEISLNLNEPFMVPDYSALVLPSDTCNFIATSWQSIEAGTPITSDVTFDFTATDDAGNVSTCQIHIDITYPILPVIPVCPDTISFFTDENCEVIVTDHTGDISSQFTPEQINLVVHQNPEPGTYSSVEQIEFWITDEFGQSSEHCFTPVVSIDNTPPVLIEATDAVLYLDNNCEAIIPDFSEWITYTDACSDVITFSQNPAVGSTVNSVQNISATYWVMDETGNTTQLPYLFNIQVLDTIAPVLLSMGTMVLYQTDNCQYNMPDLTTAVTTISCDEVTVSQSIPAGLFTPETNFTGFSITAVDGSGNDVSIFVPVIFADTISPVLSPLDDLVIPQDPGVCGAQIDLLPLIEVQDCDELTTIIFTEDFVGYYDIGSYDISYYAMDGSGNFSDTMSVHIIVEDTEAPQFVNVNDTIICQLPFAQPIYVMDCGEIIQVEENNPALTIGSNTLQYTYSDGVHTVNFSYVVEVQEIPVFDWTQLDDQICDESIPVSIAVNGIEDYNLYLDGTIMIGSTILFEQLITGNHTLEIEVNHLGCLAQESQTFEVIPMPVLDMNPEVIHTCGNTTAVELNTIGGNPEWNVPSQITLNEITAETFEIVASEYGSYTVYASVMSGGCVAIDSTTIHFYEEVQSPFAGDDQQVYLTNSAQLEGQYSGPGITNWYSPDASITFDDTTSLQTMVNGLVMGENTLILYVENGTCSASDTVTVVVGGLFIPSGFSPNGDGKNDQFVIKGVENMKEVTLVIVNQWGQTVYTSSRYLNDWDGRDASGDILPDDTYFYEINLDGEKHHGYIIVKR